MKNFKPKFKKNDKIFHVVKTSECIEKDKVIVPADKHCKTYELKSGWMVVNEDDIFSSYEEAAKSLNKYLIKEIDRLGSKLESLLATNQKYLFAQIKKKRNYH